MQSALKGKLIPRHELSLEGGWNKEAQPIHHKERLAAPAQVAQESIYNGPVGFEWDPLEAAAALQEQSVWTLKHHLQGLPLGPGEDRQPRKPQLNALDQAVTHAQKVHLIATLHLSPSHSHQLRPAQKEHVYVQTQKKVKLRLLANLA